MAYREFNLLRAICIISICTVTPLGRKIIWKQQPSGWLQNKYLLIGILLCGGFMAVFYGKLLRKWLEHSKLLSIIGKSSYQIYLYHYLILHCACKYFELMWQRGVVMILGTSIIAMIEYKVIDKNIYRLAKKILWLKSASKITDV